VGKIEEGVDLSRKKPYDGFGFQGFHSFREGEELWSLKASME